MAAAPAVFKIFICLRFFSGRSKTRMNFTQGRIKFSARIFEVGGRKNGEKRFIKTDISGELNFLRRSRGADVVATEF